MKKDIDLGGIEGIKSLIRASRIYRYYLSDMILRGATEEHKKSHLEDLAKALSPYLQDKVDWDEVKARRIIRSNMRLVHYKKFNKPAVKMRGYDDCVKALTQTFKPPVDKRVELNLSKVAQAIGDTVYNGKRIDESLLDQEHIWLIAERIVSQCKPPQRIWPEEKEILRILDKEYSRNSKLGQPQERYLTIRYRQVKALCKAAHPVREIECKHNGYTIRNVCHGCGKFLNKEESDKCSNGG